METRWHRCRVFWLEYCNVTWGLIIISTIVLFGAAVNFSQANGNTEIKVDEKMKPHMKPASHSDMFYFTHWFGFGLVPNIAEDSITSYDGLALENGFFRGRKDANGRLIYLESWSRDRSKINLSTPVGTETLGSLELPEPPSSSAVDAATKVRSVRNFIQINNEPSLREIPYAQTEGESQFILLRMFPATIKGELPSRSAHIVEQYVSEAREFHYSSDGVLQRIVTYRSENNFEPVEITP